MNHVRQLKRLSVLAVLIGFNTGCAALSDKLARFSLNNQVSPDVAVLVAPKGVITPAKEVNRYPMLASWDDAPALVWENTQGKLLISAPGLLPAKFADIHISATTKRDHTVQDLMDTLGVYGLPSLIADPIVARTVIPITNYKGTVGNLLKAVSSSMAISFTWDGAVLAVGATGHYDYALAQNEIIIKAVKRDLKALGATHIAASKVAGTLSFDADRKHDERIQRYMATLASAMGTVNLQIVTLSVVTDRSISGNDVSIARRVNDALKQRGDGGLDAVIASLSRYGETHIGQSVLLKTLSATPVSVINQNNTYYEKGNIETGMSVSVTPVINVPTKTVTLALTVDVKNASGFSSDDPAPAQTQRHAFTDTAKVKLGETVVLSGATSSQLSRYRCNAAASTSSACQPTSSKQVAHFIIVRPTATLYRFSAKKD